MFELEAKAQFKLKDDEIVIFTTKDTGPGGQHRNKTESCVVMRHIPTGIEAKAAAKSQYRNKQLARDMLESRVENYYQRIERENHRKAERGSGMRGDKIRTYREKDDVVIDHKSETKYRLRDIKNGKLESILTATAHNK